MRLEKQRSGPKGPVTPPPKKSPPRVLVLGIGNPGRRDDGLGAAAVNRLEAMHIPGVSCDANYQLNIEDALACARHDIVIIVDAAAAARRPYSLIEIKAEASYPPTSHSLGPAAVLSLCSTLYGRTPEAHLLAIRGYDWEIGGGLSPRAEANLGQAVEFVGRFITRKRVRKGGRM